ncbi:ATP-binding protein [Peterkaempfera sp. SMS 1(5)a]|uniref:ATP-binding protein n=1 Tax=Peterkaempfera podocarpi TaxID=3232308 RepID=UPI00366FD4CE
MRVHTDAAHPRAERPLLRRTLLALLATAALAGAVAAWAVASAPASFRTPLAVGSGVAGLLLCGTVAAAVHQREQARRVRTRAAAAAAEASAATAVAAATAAAAAASATAFADDAVPALLDRLRDGSSWDSALAAVATPVDPAHQRALRQLAVDFAQSENRRAAAMSACANVAGRMQALSTSMLADLREMEHRHGDADVLGDLLHLDHRTAQAGRLADSIAVLTGARSGRRWARPIVMESVLRGATGRIAGYQRVRLHSTTDIAVAGHAAEGVMHALAEILDNACNFSPPTTEVHVYVAEVPAGVVITVEDSGLVMSDVALRRAERAVSGDAPDLTALSGTRLGLAVVGRLARKHGLTVSFRPSASGGTGVVMLLPQELVTRPQAAPEPEAEPQSPPAAVPQARKPLSAAPDPTGAPQERTAPQEHIAPEERSPSHTLAVEPLAADPSTGSGGLPRRSRGRTMAAAHPGGLPAAQQNPLPDQAAARGPRPAADSAARFGAFRRAVTGQDPAGTAPAPTTASLSEDDR